jgi:hypothetical protein
MAVPMPALRGREKDNPPLCMCGATHSGTDDLVTVHCNDGLIFLATGKHLREPVDRVDLEGGELFPEMQDAIEIVGMKVANAPNGHCCSLVLTQDVG